jgi:hypothetical protein
MLLLMLLLWNCSSTSCLKGKLFENA